MGICYEKGLGVQRNLGEAVRCYQQSAALGNAPAQERLRTLFSMEAAGTDESQSQQVPPRAQYPVTEKRVAVAFGLFVTSAPLVGTSTAF